MKNIKILYKSLENIIQLFNDYSRILSVAKCRRRKPREGLKILTPKQMLQRLPVAVAQAKAGNTLNLLNEIRQIKYSLYQEKEITKKNIEQYNEFGKVINQNGYYIYEF